MNNPDLAVDPDIAAKIAVHGMANGLFTGVKLDTYINDTKTDYVDARAIINSEDPNSSSIPALVAGYAETYDDLLETNLQYTHIAFTIDAKTETTNQLLIGGLAGDRLYGGTGNDTLIGRTGNNIMDGGSGYDTVKYEDSLRLLDVKIVEATSPTIRSTNLAQTDIISNIERIDATSQKDKLDISLLVNTKVQEIHAGAGSDTVSVSGSAVGSKPVIYLEDGDDILSAAPRGSIVYGGTGNDTFALGQDYLVADAEAGDKFVYIDKTLTGGVRWKGQESPWATGLYGIKYGKNADGELVIEDRSGKDTYVANFNFSLSGASTAGITVGEMSLSTYRLFDAPHGAQIYESFEAVMGGYLKAMTGTSYFTGVDPLVLDMDGDGLELNARTSVAPYYDIDADGFGEQAGWVRGDDAILARDLNGNVAFVPCLGLGFRVVNSLAANDNASLFKKAV